MFWASVQAETRGVERLVGLAAFKARAAFQPAVGIGDFDPVEGLLEGLRVRGRRAGVDGGGECDPEETGDEWCAHAGSSLEGAGI